APMDWFRGILSKRPTLTATVCAGLLLVMIAVAATHGPSPAGLDAADAINTIPTRNAVTVHPRVLTAYGTLIATAVMSILYLYRRRSFILHWLASFLLLATALSALSWLVTFAPAAVVTDIALLCLALSAVMLRVAADSFPRNPVHSEPTLILVGAIALWSVVGAAVLPGRNFIDAGMLFTAGLL